PSGTQITPAALSVAEPYNADAARSSLSSSCKNVGAQTMMPQTAPFARKKTIHSISAAGLRRTVRNGPRLDAAADATCCDGAAGASRSHLNSTVQKIRAMMPNIRNGDRQPNASASAPAVTAPTPAPANTPV